MLDKVIKFSLRNRFFVVCLAALCVVWGLKVVKDMPVDVFPDLNRPTVTIMAEAGGLAPEEVESSITIPLQASMNGLPGVSRVRSSSAVGLSIVWVEFDWGTNLLINRQLVSEKLITVKEQIPDNITPIMGPISSLMGEIMLLGLRSDSIAPMELRSIADWMIKPRLQAISGVAQVTPIGGGVKQIQIKVDPIKLQAYDLTFQQVVDSLRHIGENTTGGFVESAYQEYLVRNISTTKSLTDIQETVVHVKNHVPITLKRIAEVSYGPQSMRGDAGINKTAGVILGIQKQPGANTITLTKDILAVLEELKPSLPEGVQLVELFKQANFIEAAIGNVEEALRDGSIFVAVILFLFLVNLRTTAITLTAIPLSLLITFIVLKLFGISINTMTLGGLAVAIGELVDDAIVDVENVFRRLKENAAHGRPQSALKVIFAASSEVRNSIVMSTMMVILVFLPLLALDGLEGRFFIPLGIAYIVSILASLVVSLTITPALCSYLLPNAKATQEEKDGLVVTKLKHWDKSILDRIIDHPRVVLTSCFAMVFLAAASIAFMGREFLPAFNEGSITAFVVSPPGTSLAESNRIGSIAEGQLLKVPEMKVTGRRTGRAEEDEHAEGVYNTEIDVEILRSERSRSEIINHARTLLKEIPGVGIGLGQPISHRLDHMMSGVQAQIAVKIFGDDLATLRQLAEKTQGIMAPIPGLVDLQIERMTVVPQIQIIPEVEKAKAFGLPPGFLSQWLSDALAGSVVEQIVDNQRRIAVNVRMADQTRSHPETIKNLLVDTPTGRKVPLGQLGSVHTTTGPNAINHENGKRRIIVMANTHERDLGSVVEDVQAAIAKKLKLPQGYFIAYDGQFQSQISATRSIAGLSIFSLIAAFLILFSYFRSAFFACQVLLNIPLALIGSVTAVYLTGGTFSIGTLVGFITLCGIASRNGILLISHYLHLIQHEGYEFNRELIIKGSLDRLVPMLMTALTAGLALIPLAMAGDAPGKEILHPVAVVILGGLMTSTFLDILVTPTVFWNFGRRAAEATLAKRDQDHDDLDQAA